MSDNRCQWQKQDDKAIVQVAGEVDLSWSQEVRKIVLEAVASRLPVAVDLSKVSYIDSSGIAALVEGFQLSRTHQQAFALIAISHSVRSVLELARLDRVFSIHDDVPAFDAARQATSQS